MEKKTNKTLIIVIVTVVLLIAIAAIIAVVVVNNNKRSSQTVQQPTSTTTTVAQTEDPVKDEISETTVVTEPAPAEETTDVEPEVEEVAEVTEPEKEFVDWETWATQADNDDICLVVWNDVTKKNDIVTKFSAESKERYVLEEGDRVAFPNRIILEGYSIDNNEQSYDYHKAYKEIIPDFTENGTCNISIYIKNDDGNWIIDALYLIKKAE